MNIMRKIVPGNRGMMDSAQHVQDNNLGLMHLRKLFSEFRSPPPGVSQKELRDKLYNMLPLFCKVFGTAPSGDMTEKFPDILQFCGHVSRLMVSEIRKRASDQSTESASYAIVKFLEIESTEESSNGWMLLSTINLLSSGESSLIDCMTAACLPSTLVKCLYLFFDLPDVQKADMLEPGCEFTPKERQVLLQKVFVQVLVRLCSHVSPAEELARKDDLALLFSAITSWCPVHNVPWRKSAAEILMTLSRHGLTPNVVQYIHSKGCVGMCIDNMQRVQELSPIELVEMFVTVFCFLKDSSEVSQVLLDDFRTCQGYLFLTDFLLRMEKNDSEEAIQALRNLVLLVGSLTTCGYMELKPSTASAGSLFKIPGFTIPQPAGKGVSVRNIQAFQVLQTVFLKGTSVNMCSTILDVLSSIYHQDSANYFILEGQNTLPQFAEKIHSKPSEIQIKFFEILEFLVFNLNFVPCKELISLSILIKSNHSTECTIRCIKTLLKILHHHTIYKDVFREVGLLEVMVTCLHRYAALLKEVQNGGPGNIIIPAQEQEIGFLVMDALCLLLSNNNNNANVFRECGGARCAHNMVPYLECRQQALSIVQQLVLSSGGDDDMGTLLGLMHTASTTALELKTHVLKSLLHVLKESHRTRTVFRKVGGFVYVMSVLVSMEGCLAEPPKAPWDTAERREVVLLLKTVFSTLTVAMRYEPANARVFATEVRYASLTEAVRLLGCFSADTQIQPVPSDLKAHEETLFVDLFFNMHKDVKLAANLPQTLVSACMMLRYLYDMALDNFDRPISQLSECCTSPNIKRISSVLESSSDSKDPVLLGQTQKRASTGSMVLNLTPNTQPEPLLVHAGAVISMLHLVPAIKSDSHPQLALDLQMQTCEVIRGLVRTERNQQIMCEAGLPHELLSNCSLALTDETHLLHPPLQYMFERLAAQCLTPKDLRDFLRLGSPLCCAAEEEDTPNKDLGSDSSDISIAVDQSDQTDMNSKPAECKTPAASDIHNKLKTNGGAVPLTRVKCLVSMTTPRDVRLHGASITPAFVEFDMSAEGFGCLYLPSIAPQGPPTPSVVSTGMIGGSDPAVVGGIGTGERVFPPQSGLTFVSWLCIDKFSCPTVDPHPVRLLTIVRNIQGREENIICLNVYLASRDRALFVSTQESLMPNSGEAHHEPLPSDTTVRFWCPELTQEGQWRHLVLIFHKAGIMKNSSVSLFIDGSHVDTQKLHYISPNLGGTGTASPNAATTVFAYISTPPQLRRRSRLLWRQGPCNLFEDIISTATVRTLYQLGPNYIGSFQAPVLDSNDTPSAIINEEKIVFGIHAHAMSLMTVARIRKVYNKTDAKSIGKQLGMSAHENATPIRILHNSAAHLSGSARSFGAILMGYLGVRTFCPKPVARMIMNVGGTSALLGLIAMATDVEGLYAAVKALVCVVRSNKEASKEMDRTKGYQTLAILFKKKHHLLNSHILHLTFSLVGTLDSRRETTIIPNKTAFEDLICDLEVWREAPLDLQRSLYEHFYELLTESSDQKNILKMMQEMGLVNKLLHILYDSSLTRLTVHTIMSVISVLLSGTSHSPSLLRFGQFMVSLLSSTNEKSLIVESTPEFIGGKRPTPTEGDMFDTSGTPLVYNIKLRNLCLEMLFHLLTLPPTSNGVNVVFSEELQKTLGFDWIMLFMSSGVHITTVIVATRLLLLMLQHNPSLQKFRDGVSGGGWLADTECVLKNRIGVLLGFNVGSGTQKTQNYEINQDICHIPGFCWLQWLMPQHAEVPQLYLLMMSLLLGQPLKQLPKNVQFDLDTVWTVIFGSPISQPVPVKGKTHKLELCGEAACVLLSMVRALLNQPWQDEPETSYIREYPITPIQFILYLYHNQPDFVPICMTSEFLTALSATLFPYRCSSENTSEVATPQEDFKSFTTSEPIVYVKGERTPPYATTLSNHPACKFIMDFLRMIIVDSLSLPQTNKSAPVIDLILEVSPENSTQHQRRVFQTHILNSLMDHLLAADVLLGDQAALPIAAGGSYAHTANNVFYLAGRVVDKLWQGAYVRDPKEVFEFISKLISQAKRKASGVSLDGIYKCLNRTILFQLSRPMYTLADHTNILDALHKLTEHRNLIFGPGNFDQEFFGCLCYCLLQLTDDPHNICDPPGLRTTTWHVDVSSTSDTDTEERITDPVHSAEGLLLLATAARRVWDELYICKKPAIEEIFKVTLTPAEASPSAKYSVPDLCAVRPQIQETAAKIWITYYENERKCVYSNTEKLQSQIQTKLQKVGHGVLRLAQRKTKKETSVKPILMTSQECLTWMSNHINIVKDLVEFQHKQYVQSQQHMESYLLEEWRAVEAELMRERGLWGPPVGSKLDKWMLDLTEGPHRMRKKLMPNDQFYVHYPYRPPSDESKPTKYKMAISKDSKKYYERYRSRSLVAEELLPGHLDVNTEESMNNSIEQSEHMFDDLAVSTPSLLPKLTKSKTSQNAENDDEPELDISMSSEGTSEGEGQSEAENKTDNQTILKLLEEGEKISHMFRCARIQGLDTMEGLLLFGKEHFYIVDGFTLLRSKEIADIDNLPPDMHDPIIPKTAKGSGIKKLCNKFSYEDIREVHKRRYLLQPIAVEVFSSDGRNLLLACPRKVRNKVYARFMTLATAITDNAQESVSGQKQNAKVEPGTGLISSLIGEKSVTQRWERGEISNFEYLMCLNTLAGRSYNDLMQYPVFPWILADYQSEELDLTNPSTFRDMSKPMGAQTPNRLKQFKKRYTDWDDPQGETPPYHYGTHYSSAMIVASYLVRMEPFTQIFLRLQGGHFDLADRMFHSVGDGWLSASKHNMADVKELIPEFFYLPEFLLNSNNFDLGTKQSGVALGDVVLPAWAKNDPREFIRVHRQALECDYISAHLNEWIDLIFGYKQQGPAAVEAVNVFHHLFYEGNVDIYSIEDPLKKSATIGFINNFGQIPKQLFKKPHPQKKLNIPRSLDALPLGSMFSTHPDKLFFHHLDNLRPTMTPIKELKSVVGQIIHNDRNMLAVEQNKVLIPPAYNKYLAWGFSDLSLRIGNYDSDKATHIFENVGSGEILTAACPDSKTVITAGTSTVVYVWQFGKGKDRRLILKRSLYGHTEPVTCLSASAGYNIIVSGSRDRTCIVWDLSRLLFVRQLRGHAAPVAAICINELTGDIATCAGTYLYVWSINGEQIASINTATGRNQQIFCVVMSQMMEWDSRNVIMTGGSDGVVRMWSVEFVEVAAEPKTPSKTDSNTDYGDCAKSDGTSILSATSQPQTIPGSCKHQEECSAADRLKDFKDPEFLTAKVEDLGSSAESDTGNAVETMRQRVESLLGSSSSASIACHDKISNGVPHQEHSEQNLGLMSFDNSNTGTGSGYMDDMSSSPSQTEAKSPLDFVMVTDMDVKEALATALPSSLNQETRSHHLQDGFKWQRQLVFRSKLTMHTAFERKDNKDPAAVTAIAVSKDHKTVYVGDAKGRVYSWTVTDQPGRVVADHWVKDEGGDSCQGCNVKFSFSERRHHCRNCGQLFCSKCSRYETEIKRLRIVKPVRVCQVCYNSLKAVQAADALSKQFSAKV